MRPVAYVTLPIAEFREKVNDFGNDSERLAEWVKLFSKTLAMMGANEPKDEFALRLLNDVEKWRKDKADKMRRIREERKNGDDKKPQPEVLQPEVVQGEPKPPKVVKNVFGELKNVRLSDDEEDKLRQRLGVDFDLAITILSNYKASSGRTYKSDYAAILNWVIKRIDEEKAKKGGGMSQAQRLAGMMMGGRG